jgi:hypothetical protein
MDPQRRHARNVSRAQQQRWIASAANAILAHVVAARRALNCPFDAPITVAFGNPTFMKERRGKRGSRTPPLKQLLRFFAQHFQVVVINEYNTSRMCARCGGALVRLGDDFYRKVCRWCRHAAPAEPTAKQRRTAAIADASLWTWARRWRRATSRSSSTAIAMPP